MQIRTPRLILRELRMDDYEAIRAFESDPVVALYEGDVPDAANTRWRLEGALEFAAETPRVRFKLGITAPPADRVIGRISLTRVNAAIGEWEIGWTMLPAEWGKGYATEAARGMLGYTFNVLAAHRLTAFCHVDNLASVRVMEKLGMTREGRLRETRWIQNAWVDELVYAILEHEFFQQPGGRQS